MPVSETLICNSAGARNILVLSAVDFFEAEFIFGNGLPGFNLTSNFTWFSSPMRLNLKALPSKLRRIIRIFSRSLTKQLQSSLSGILDSKFKSKLLFDWLILKPWAKIRHSSITSRKSKRLISGLNSPFLALAKSKIVLTCNFSESANCLILPI